MGTQEPKKDLSEGNFNGNFLKIKVTKVTRVGNFLIESYSKVTEKVTALNAVNTTFNTI